MINTDRIGVGIVTYNSEPYFKTLYDSIPFDMIEECVVINGGEKYKGDYKYCDWIQHSTNHYPSVCRNDALRYLEGRKVEHFFIIEDDMIIKNPNIFNEYIETSKASGVEYLCFVSTGDGSGTPEHRTPRLTVEYENGKKVSMYRNMCNEFTYRSRHMLKACGYYDERFRHLFDVDSVYRKVKTGYTTPFWWFPDIHNSDQYIMNNPDAKSRLQAGGQREKDLQREFPMFSEKHGIHIPNIENMTQERVIEHLKGLKP